MFRHLTPTFFVGGGGFGGFGGFGGGGGGGGGVCYSCVVLFLKS